MADIVFLEVMICLLWNLAGQAAFTHYKGVLVSKFQNSGLDLRAIASAWISTFSPIPIFPGIK
ncbi:MAG: hypothetical protein WB696_20495 [Chthoniobacterales bacterium]